MHNIVNMKNSFPKFILDSLPENFDIYLTGSRYFGTNTDESDWDFFIENNSTIIDHLLVLGYKRVTKHTYNDSLTESVWRKTIFLPDCKVTYIDIQVIKFPLGKNIKIKAQEFLYRGNYLSSIDNNNKSLLSKTWDYAINHVASKK